MHIGCFKRYCYFQGSLRVELNPFSGGSFPLRLFVRPHISDVHVLSVLSRGVSERSQHEVDHVTRRLSRHPVAVDGLSANLAVISHVGMVDLSLEFNGWRLERVLAKVKRNDELATLEGVLSINNHLPVEGVRIVKERNGHAVVVFGLDVLELFHDSSCLGGHLSFILSNSNFSD